MYDKELCDMIPSEYDVGTIWKLRVGPIIDDRDFHDIYIHGIVLAYSTDDYIAIAPIIVVNTVDRCICSDDDIISKTIKDPDWVYGDYQAYLITGDIAKFGELYRMGMSLRNYKQVLLTIPRMVLKHHGEVVYTKDVEDSGVVNMLVIGKQEHTWVSGFNGLIKDILAPMYRASVTELIIFSQSEIMTYITNTTAADIKLIMNKFADNRQIMWIDNTNVVC